MSEGAPSGSRDLRGAAVRAGAEVIGLAAAGLLARSGEVSAAERRAFEAVGRLPRAAAPGLWAVMQAGSLAAVFVAAGLALGARRPRLAADVAASGTTAWVAAKLVKQAVRRDRPSSLLPGVRVVGRPQSGLGFPSGHAAVAAAMMTAASPHLALAPRAAGWTAVALVATARVFVGAHLPLDVAGGLLLGSAVGNAVRLTPGAAPALGAAAKGARLWRCGPAP